MQTITMPTNNVSQPSSYLENRISAREVSKKFNLMVLISILVIVILGIWYILLTSSLATRGFELEELKNQRMTLRQELEKVEISATIPTSLYALQSSEIVQEMPEVHKQKFLYVMENQVALK